MHARKPAHRRPAPVPLGEVLAAGEGLIRRHRRRWDVAGDMAAMMVVVLLVLAVVAAASRGLAGAVAAFGLVLVCAGFCVVAWLMSARPVSGTEVIARGITRVGGPGALPATVLRSRVNLTLLAAAQDFVDDAGLQETERVTLDLLAEEGFEGSLAELVETSRRLNH